MRGKIVATNNKEREKYIGTFGEILLNDGLYTDKILQIKIENEGERNGKYFTTSNIKRIIVDTDNSTYIIETI